MTPWNVINLVVPLVSGVLLWFVYRKINKAEEQREEDREAREKRDLLTLDVLLATTCLCEQVARAQQEGNIKGDPKMDEALGRAKSAKWALEKFIREQGMKNTM